MSTLQQKVLNTIQRFKLWQPGQRVSIAVSGGVDSISLMHLLYRTQAAHKAILQVVAIDHGLREGSAGEVNMVGVQASELGLPFFSVKLDLRKGGNLQERARIARKDALLSIPSDWIATGPVSYTHLTLPTIYSV